MPGFELIGKEELAEIESIFRESGGVLFAHGFDAVRKNRFRVRELEKKFASRMESEYAQAVSSGTAAGLVALKAAGVKEGDEVITQAFTFVATVESILMAGATPVVVDVDESLNMCPKALENAVTAKTKCIMPVHMLGNPAKMDEIMAIAQKSNLLVIEDNCEALGATYKGKHLGTIGDAGFVSLDFGKVITAGEGGLITTNSQKIYDYAAAYADHGHENNPSFPRGADTASFWGFNFRLTELQAAVALAQLKKLDLLIETNRKHKTILKERLTGLSLKFREITDHNGELGDTLMFFVENKELATRIVDSLSKAGLGTKNVPDAMKWHFAKYWDRIWASSLRHQQFATDWQASERLLERCISLPINVGWSDPDAQADKFFQAIKAVL